MRHQNPYGDLAPIINQALTLLIADIERRKVGLVARPSRLVRPTADGSRHLPAEVKREVWERDGGRCVFEGPQGRCGERGLLEFHHLKPFAEGGPATVDNIELRCRAHNAYEAELVFGRARGL